MFGVCYRHDHNGEIMNQWEYILSNFNVENCWIRNAPTDFVSFHKPTQIQSADELPDAPLVVLSHPEGRNYKGVVSIVDFKHPPDAIYLFGADHIIMSDDDIGEREIHSVVYVPSGQYEMYSYVAASIVLYDRLIKNG